MQRKLVIIPKISTSKGTNALTFDEEEYNNFIVFFDMFLISQGGKNG